jgi:hypothetical protein
MTRRHVRRWALGLLTIVAACGTSDLVGPEGDLFDAFVESMDVESLQELVVSSDAQIEVELLPGGLTAEVLAVRRERSEEERIQSRIVALDPSAGSLTLLLGELTISFNAETGFWFGGDNVGREHFFAEVQGALEAGKEPAVVVERPVPEMPQDPDDPDFVAHAVALTGEGSPSLRVNIDADNLVWAVEPAGDEPDGWLTVFGIHIQLRVRDGTTAIESHHHDFEELEDFEAVVHAVNLDAGTLTVGDGAVVRIVDRTQIVEGDGLLPSLRAVAEALQVHQTVVAWGYGVVEGREPLRLLAVKVAFKIRDAEEPHVQEFEGRVGSVDLEGRALVLQDGTRVWVLDATELLAYDDHSPASLEAVAHALAAGRTVLAWGAGEVESADPPELRGLRIVLKSVIEDFEQDVATVDGGALVLESGWVVHVGEDTELVAADDSSPTTLQGASDALAAGDRVRAWGWGFVVDQEPVELDAVRVTLRRIPAG